MGELATERLVEVAQRAADAAGEVLRKYFRQRVEIIDKEDNSACYAHHTRSFVLLPAWV